MTIPDSTRIRFVQKVVQHVFAKELVCSKVLGKFGPRLNPGLWICQYLFPHLRDVNDINDAL